MRVFLFYRCICNIQKGLKTFAFINLFVLQARAITLLPSTDEPVAL